MVLRINFERLWKQGWKSEANGAAQKRLLWVEVEIPKPGDKAKLWGDRWKPFLTFPSFLVASEAQQILLDFGMDNGIFLVGSILFRLVCRQLEGEPPLRKMGYCCQQAGSHTPRRLPFECPIARGHYNKWQKRGQGRNHTWLLGLWALIN